MANISNISVNTSQALVPTSYSLQQVTITNHAGKQNDIKALVTDFTITESVYRSALVLSMNVKDPLNLIEELQLTGQEVINVVLARAEFGSNDQVTIDLNFYVSEYPLLGKYDTRLQVYTIRGVTEHAFISNLKKISRAFSGNINDFVQQVLTQDLNVSTDSINASASASPIITFIVPNLSPLDAISWALRRSFDSTGSPYYCFQTLDGTIHIQSQTDMISQESYKEYIDAKFYEYVQDGKTDAQLAYEERSKRILSIASELKMSKYISAKNGAFASKTQYLDLSTKSLLQQNFNYSDTFSKMTVIDKFSVLSPSFKPENTSDTLAGYPNSKVNYISTNSMSFDKANNYNSATTATSINKAQCYTENLETLTHDVTLAGDFQLVSGSVISLKLPPSIDPQVKTKNSNAKGDLKKDIFFSGNYLVTSVVHNFAEEYTVDLKVKKDSLSFDLSVVTS